MASNGNITRGYIYTRLWHTNQAPFNYLYPGADNSPYHEWITYWNNRLDSFLANAILYNDPRTRITEPELSCFFIAVGQTERDLESRYAHSKSPTPLKEWSVLVESPRKQEDKLRANFKSFLSDEIYHILRYKTTEYRELDWLTEWKKMWAKHKGWEIESISVFLGAKQISTDMFIIPDLPSWHNNFYNTIDKSKRHLLFTFFNTYFTALQSQSVIQAKQGTLI